ncbi:MAG: DegT/DnrJ/EryC1/StrS family aminotransferase [Candidatus Polarisedimenticolia bacterium]
MYVPAWQGLSPRHLLRQRGSDPLPFPLGERKAIQFYRASSALYHLFKALPLEKGQIALVPDYHSGNEIWAIRAAGVPVRTYPIGRDLRPDLETLDRLATPEARVLLLIQYLGWPQPMKEIQDLCRRKGLILVEDCALSLLSRDGGQPLGTFGNYAVFCLYKTLPLPNGALLVQNTQPLPGLSSLPLRTCTFRSVAGRSMELMLGWLRSHHEITGKSLYTLKKAAGRALDVLRVRRHPLGDIGFDVSHVNIGMSSLSQHLIQRLDYAQIVRTRRRNYELLRSRLGHRTSLLRPDLPEGMVPLFFPLLVADKQAAAERLWRHGIEAVQFWNEGVPGVDGEPSSDARFLRRHVLELPIHQEVSASQVEYIAEMVLSSPHVFGPISLRRPEAAAS